MNDEDFYDHLNFDNSVQSWNDFLQPKFSNKSFNEIKQIDLDKNNMDNYLLGIDFFIDNKGFKSFYLDNIEDNIRKQLEDCDLLDKIFINVDVNSVWGGIFNSIFNEVIINELPKTTKVLQGIDEDNLFTVQSEENPKQREHNYKKYMNYIFHFSDLIQSDQTIIYSPIKNKEGISLLEELFNFKSNTDNMPISNFYSSSLLGLDNLNLLFPLLSKSKVKSNTNVNSRFLDLIIQNNNVNFFHSDFSFDLLQENSYKGYKGNKTTFTNNGTLFTYNMNLIENKSKKADLKLFNWDKHFSFVSKFKQNTFSVTHGFNNDIRLLNYPIEKFFNLSTNLNYTSINSIPLPFCFPRNIYYNGNKTFLKNMTVASIYSHDYLYSNNFLSNLPKFISEKNFQIEKYLKKLDIGKYLELSDRVEDLYRIFDFYDQFKSLSFEESDDDN